MDHSGPVGNENKLKWLGESSNNLRLPNTTTEHPNVVALEKRVATLEQQCAELARVLTKKKVHEEQLRDLNFWATGEESFQHNSTAETGAESEELTNGVSMERINEIVEQLLNKQATNFGWIPDIIERKVDRRLLQLVFGLISQTLATAAIKIGDKHELHFSLRPGSTTEPAGPAGHAKNTVPVAGNAGNLDAIIFTALKNIIGSVTVDFLGHELKLHLDE